MRTLLILPFLALAAPASAGKLADGYRGLAFGEYESIDKPAGECAADPEPEVAWSCQQTIGEVPVKVAYFLAHGIHASVLIQARGVLECNALMDTLTIAWGRSSPSNDYATDKLDDRTWRDGKAVAGWQYNQFSQECKIVMFNLDLYGEIEKRKKAKAAEAVDDL